MIPEIWFHYSYSFTFFFFLFLPQGTYRIEAELEAAVKDVDFIIEAIQENVAAKKAFFQRKMSFLNVVGHGQQEIT